MTGIFFLTKDYSNPASPEIVWKKDSKTIVGYFYAQDQTFYYGSLEGYYYAVDTNAIPKWEYKLDNQELVTRTPILSNGIMYLTSDKGNIYAIDVKTGKPIDSKMSKDDIKKAEIDIQNYRNGWLLRSGGTNKSAILEDGDQQFYEEENYLHAIDKKTGNVIWKIKSGRVNDVPIISGNTLYYLRINYNFPGDSFWLSLHAVDKFTGSSKWDWNKSVRSGPVESDGILYFMGDDYLYAVK